jgi:DNA topoisomerase I
MVKLMIVESPAKCSKIQSFLGDGYKVIATMGHIRKLDETLDSVGITKNWEPTYVEISTKKDAISKLRTAAKGVEEVLLSSDDDYEGEAIAMHICFLLKLNPATTPRVVFHEITKTAITNAVAHPRVINLNKFHAQQARAMLDLLVGFTISKVLWNRVAPKLSAGRCQTPALRLVVERDAEVENHTSSAFWKLRGEFRAKSLVFEAQANNDLETQPQAYAILEKVKTNTSATITSVKTSVSTSNAPKPFITSTLQQEASSSHGLSPKSTMQAAQKLYEAGHITYMRTDNAVLSNEAATAIRAYITETRGEAYLGPEGAYVASSGAEETPAAGVAKKGKKKSGGAAAPAEAAAPQAAHEAIRPTHPEEPEPLISDATQKTVYRLIWKRAIQCQMAASLTDVRKVTLSLDADSSNVWSAEQTKIQFAGWRALERNDPARVAEAETQYAVGTSELINGAKLTWTKLHADEQFTKPKGRYTEASLIAELEKRGIGRPSTFATLVSTIVDREYVEKTNVEGKTQDSRHYTLKPAVWPPTLTTEKHKLGAEKNKLRSTALGRSVSDFLGREFSDLFNYEFTAGMEADLDSIAKGEKPWKSLLQTTWDTYKDRYAAMSVGGAATKAAKERELGPGLKVILSRKGPLFVQEAPAAAGAGSKANPKAKFAALPASVTYESATAEDAAAAFTAAATAAEGILLGSLEGTPIYQKTGPYGPYVQCGDTRMPLRGEYDLDSICEKLKAKISFAAASTDLSGASAPYNRVVGEYTIKRGPYGLYFYKHGLKNVKFVKFPAALNPDAVTVADLNPVYSNGINKKGKFVKKSD